MQDLSHLTRGPLGGSSMAGGNTVTAHDWALGGAGSPSEQTSLETEQPDVSVTMTAYPPSVLSPEGSPDMSPWADAHSIGTHPAWSQAGPDQSAPGGNRPQSPRGRQV